MLEDEGLAYWMRWQVAVCAIIAALPSVIAVTVILKIEKQPLWAACLWAPCWRKVSPFWLLAYRAVAFLFMAWLLGQMVLFRGAFNFFFYTQWTFALVIIYFAIGTVASAHGCWICSKHAFFKNEEASCLLRGDLEQCHDSDLALAPEEERNGYILSNYGGDLMHEERAGLWGHFMQITYQTSAGAVMLTDVIFWCLLVPFMSSVHFRVTLMMACLHSLNAIFLIVDSILNSLPFPLFGMAFFVLWSCIYVAFQWILHACGFKWWPYPFMDLSTSWAPLWYFTMVLMHIPCFGIYYLLARAKNSCFSRLFPIAYRRLF
ncbi:uncharacterized protein LOC110032542 [Phalaenopsis equestris]|uniref:uncharacterized protein LOC110032542 n=1 Tax=Phalaenopsis equestris TaxID=78828 RepID=UPI0009E224E9|nr:uncharacterized protein LOC110032542 [Phalaenopsis equestris]